MTSRTGIRGGSTGDLSHVRQLHRDFKPDATERVYGEIITALRAGRFHADQLSELSLREPNIIGAQLGSLVKRGLIAEVARRASRNPASKGRRSGVFEFTQKGRREFAGVAAVDRPAREGRVRSGCRDPGEAMATDIASAAPEGLSPGSSGAPDRLFELEPVRRKHDTLEAA